MVKLTSALSSRTARGWLGKDQYARLGVVKHPYPIGPHFKYPYHAFYYSFLGWCYQVRPTWHGLQQIAMRPPVPANPQTPAQQANRAKFANAISSWQTLPPSEKDAYIAQAGSLRLSGFNLFVSRYMLGKI